MTTDHKAAAERLMKAGVGGFADPEDLRLVCEAVLSAPCWRDYPNAVGYWVHMGGYFGDSLVDSHADEETLAAGPDYWDSSDRYFGPICEDPQKGIRLPAPPEGETPC